MNLQTDKDLSQKIRTALKQCSKEEINDFELDNEFVDSFPVDNEFTFGLVGTITKKLRQLVSKIKCSVRVIGETIGNGDLKNVYVKFRDDIAAILKYDVRQCFGTKGLKAKIE